MELGAYVQFNAGGAKQNKSISTAHVLALNTQRLHTKPHIERPIDRRTLDYAHALQPSRSPKSWLTQRKKRLQGWAVNDSHGFCSLVCFLKLLVMWLEHSKTPKGEWGTLISAIQTLHTSIIWYLLEQSHHYFEARNDYTNDLETIHLCNRCACNLKIRSRWILVCHWHVHRKYLMETP